MQLSSWRRKLFLQTWHPSFEELMIHLDGQSRSRTDRVGAHVQSCWSCRLRREEIERTISAFMKVRDAALRDTSRFPTRLLPVFEARLEQLDTEVGNASFFSGLGRTLAQGFAYTRTGIFAVALALIVLLVIRLNSFQTVSADEVLHQVRESEARQVREVAAPVIYSKLRLCRSSSRQPAENLTWEIWSHAATNRLRQRVEDADGVRFLPLRRTRLSKATPEAVTELEKVFRTHQADFGRPLSASNYERWRRSIREESDEVRETRLPNGEKAIILKVSGQGPFAPDAIVSSEYAVRAGDWHPVEQHLRVQKENEVVEYTLGEVAFDVIAAETLPASFFPETPAPRHMASLRVPEFPPLSTVPGVEPPPMPVLELLPLQADLLAEEVEAWYALHTVKACLGRPLAVVRGTREIEVLGVVETEERRTEVNFALRGIPHVVSRLKTLDETPDGNGASDTQAQSGPLVMPNRNLPIESLLKQYFAGSVCASVPADTRSRCVQEKIGETSRSALARSDAAMSQAWALRHLAEWEIFLKRGELRTSTRRLMDLMVRDHMDALKKQLDQWRGGLEPILSSLPIDHHASPARGEQAPAVAPETSSDWAATKLLHLFAGVRGTSDLTLGMLADTNRPVTQGEVAVKDVLLRFAELDGEFHRVKAELGMELSESRTVLTWKGRSGSE
jgi:hypothetical protein